MAKATETQHTHTVAGSDGRVHNRTKHGRTTTLQGASEAKGYVVGDLVNKQRIEHRAVAKAAKVEVRAGVHLALRAQDVITGPALVAVAARVVVQAPADAVAGLEHLDIAADLRDNTNAFVAKGNFGLAEVQVRAAQARVGNVDNDLVRTELAARALGSDNLAAGATGEYGTKFNLGCAHGVSSGKRCSAEADFCRMTREHGPNLSDFSLEAYISMMA